MAAQAACGSNCLFYSVPARPHTAPGRALSLASQLPPRPPQPSMSAGLRKQLVGATFFSTRYIPDRMRRLAGPYRWQASSHPDLCSRQCRHGCASSLWEQLSFLFCTCPLAYGAWQGPIAGKPAPTQTSAAVNVGMAAQAACGSNCLFYSVHARSHAAPGRALSLASQLPPRPLQPSMSAWLRKQLVGAGLPAIASGPAPPASRASPLPQRGALIHDVPRYNRPGEFFHLLRSRQLNAFRARDLIHRTPTTCYDPHTAQPSRPYA
jgi:hypothetical protein